MGVPITMGDAERHARQLWMGARADEIVANARVLLDIRDQALVEAESADTPYAAASASHSVTTTLIYQRRALDHICRNADLITDGYFDLVQGLDHKLDDILLEAMRIPDDTDRRLLKPWLGGSLAAGGVGATHASVLADPIFLASSTKVFKLTAKVLGLRPRDVAANPSHPMRKRITAVARRLDHKYQQLYDDFIDLLDTHGEDKLLTNTKILPHKVHDVIKTKILGAFDNGDPPGHVPQRTFRSTHDYYDLQRRWLEPVTAPYDVTWMPQRCRRYARTLITKNTARNANKLWMLPVTKRRVLDRTKLIMELTEAEFAVAVREYFGIGYVGLFGVTAQVGRLCSCRLHTQLDPVTGQHLAGCPYGQGHRSSRHRWCQEAIVDLAKHAKTPLQFRDVAPPLSTPGRQMDIVITIPDTGTTFYLDITASNSLGQSVQGNTPTAEMDARDSLFRRKTKRKAEHYHAEADHFNAILIPFSFDSDGGFHPRDPDYTVNGKLDPKAALHKIFNKGKTAHAVAGTTPISAEGGFIKLLARRAGDPLRGIGAFDATLTVKAAAGTFKSQAMDILAYRAIRGPARAVIASLTRRADSAVTR